MDILVTQAPPSSSREGDATQMRRRSACIATERTHRLLIEQIVFQVEMRAGAGESLLQASGKPAFRKSLEGRSGTCDATVAEHIFLGISGYLFRAFRVRRGRVTAEVLREFQVCVREAIERGVEDAREALGVLSSRSIAGERATVRVLRALDGRLERWFSEQHGQLLGSFR